MSYGECHDDPRWDRVRALENELDTEQRKHEELREEFNDMRHELYAMKKLMFLVLKQLGKGTDECETWKMQLMGLLLELNERDVAKLIEKPFTEPLLKESLDSWMYTDDMYRSYTSYEDASKYELLKHCNAMDETEAGGGGGGGDA
jgi:alpha-amylase/alpha-mannosidase (GH57 family)